MATAAPAYANASEALHTGLVLARDDLKTGILSHLTRRGHVIDGAFVDVGNTKADVFVTSEEVRRLGLAESDVGSSLQVLVTDPETDTGLTLGSVERAKAELEWRSLEKFHAESTVVTASVTQVVPGGLLVDIQGATAFLPARLIAFSGRTELGEYVGKRLDVCVTELSKRRRRDGTVRRRVICSGRAAIRERTKQRRAKERERREFIRSLEPGLIVTGRLVGRRQFGALFALAHGVTAICPSGEFPHQRWRPPGTKSVKLAVISAERREDGRLKVTVSRTQAMPNPWTDALVVVGATYRARVTGIGTAQATGKEFGVFCELPDFPGLKGLCHISELSAERVQRVTDAVSVGDEVQVRVISFDREAKRMGLSIRRAAR